MSERRLALLVCLALALLTLLVYWPSLDGEFLRYDEEAYVTKNPVVQQALNPEGIAWAFSLDPSTIYWHPLTWLSHMLDVQLFGLNPRGHHLGSVLLHTLSTLLLFLVLLRATGRFWPGAVVAVLFSLHPLHVESVCWIAERKDVLSGFFWMLTMGAYVLYVERPGAMRYVVVLVCFALGLMSKPMLVTMPFVLLLLDYWPLRRLSRENWPKLALEKLPFLVMAAAAGAMAFLVQRDLGAVSLLDELPLRIRLGNALVSYAGYLANTVWPVRLATFYPHPGLDLETWRVVVGGAVVVAVSAFVIWQRHRRYLTVGWLWYLGTLVPVIGLVQAGDQSMADRFTYIPLIGLFIMIAWGVPDLLPEKVKGRSRQLALGVPTAVVFLALTLLTSNQIATWQNSIQLWQRALVVTEGNYFAHNNLGQAFNDAGRYEEAAEQYAAATVLNPAWPEGYSNLGIVLTELGRTDEAIAEFQIALDKKYAQTGGLGDEVTGVFHYGMSLALAEAERRSEAIEHLRKALSLKSDFAAAHYALGKQLEVTKDYPGAIEQYREALRIEPGMIPAQNNLAVVLFYNGDHEGAWEAVAKCRALGFEPAEGFLRALGEKMPDPGSDSGKS